MLLKVTSDAARNSFSIDTADKETSGRVGRNSGDTIAVGGTLETTLKSESVPDSTSVLKNTQRTLLWLVRFMLKTQRANQSWNRYGHGNEPLKIYCKEVFDQEMGSVFWNYRRNLEKKILTVPISLTQYGAMPGKPSWAELKRR